MQEFNARRRAGNFKLEGIKEVVEYCHKNGVKAYCTLNILVKNSEVKSFFETLSKLYLAGIDAVIIQEISFLPIIKHNFPGLEVHISTQAAISNSYFGDLIRQADRIVLPREFSSEEIRQFREKTKIPVEVFVQGALCFSYSGKCLFSSFLGGRSGNRGWCAQPCRRKYNEGYLLSMKDLSLANKIPALIEMGVSSLKIEGRLRSAKYVAAAAKLFRATINSYYSEKFKIARELFKELELAFNREFTEGYFSGSKDLVSPEKPMGRGIYLGAIGETGLIKLEEDVAVGDGLGIWLKDKVDGAILKKIEKNGVDVKEAFKGDTVKLFIRASSRTKIYKTSSVNKSKKIDFVRNNPIIISLRKEVKVALPEIKSKPFNAMEILVKVYSLKDASAALQSGANKVFYDIFAKDYSNKFGAYIPRILTDNEVKKAVELIRENNVKDILIGDLGVYAKLKENKELNLYLDYSNNVFNDIDMNYFYEAVPIISPELSFQELKQFRSKNFSVMVHGRIVLMNTKYSQLPASLRDEKNYVFPVRKEHTYWQILNSVELGLFDRVRELNKIRIKRFYLDLDKDVANAVKLYKDILSGKEVKVDTRNYTKGHWKKGIG